MRKKRKALAGLTAICLLMLTACGSDMRETGQRKQDSSESVKIINDNEDAGGENMEAETEKNGILVAIDPGHQGYQVDMSALEPNAPGSEVMKAKATAGTEGRYSGVPEFELCLDVSLVLRDVLISRGYDVIMTREDNETAISNAERAILANEAGADVSIRIHANGSEDPAANGALALITSPDNPNTGSIFEDSRYLAEQVLKSYCAATGFANDGIQQNDTMTGINWSQIPVMILEMGFMTNEDNDTKMADPQFREKMAEGIADGLDGYFGASGQRLTDLEKRLENLLGQPEESGERWQIAVKDLETGDYAEIGSGMMESASLIKLFTAVTVYESWEEVMEEESYEGETRNLVREMIRISDNEAANELIRRLGHGDVSEGIWKVNEFCERHGFTETHMGRLMLDFEAEDDNYTSASDCSRLLGGIFRKQYQGSEEIIEFMKEQERRSKIPSAIPESATVANKTGELNDVENDVAIIYTEKKDYVICVLSTHLSDSAKAQNKISEISGITYQYMISY